MTSPLQQAGAITESSHYATLFVNRNITGLWTQRNPMREGAVPFMYEKFYAGSRFDSLIDGLNAEISANLTIKRRPGLSQYNSQNFPAINRFYEFTTSDGATERIYVMADTATVVYDATGPATKTAIVNKSGGAGSTFFQSVGNVLYMGNGVDLKKWRPSATGVGADQAVSDWGMQAPASAPTNAPLAFAGAPCRYWAPAMNVQAGYAVMDTSGNVQLMTGNQNAAQSFTTKIAAQLSVNGVVPATLPVSVAGASPAVNGFTNPNAAFDGDPTTSASAVFQHTNAIAVCVWKFTYAGAAPTSLALNLLSGAQATVMAGSPMTAGFWLSLDNGTTWTPIWSEVVPNVRALQWSNVVLAAGQDISHVLVCGYLEAHDDAGIQGAEINLVVGTSTIPTALAGDKTTGATVPQWNTSLFGLTTDNTAIWMNLGAPAQWQAKTVFSLDGPSAAIIDSNGNLQVVQTTGVTGSAAPTWATGAGVTTADGTVVWLNCGPGAKVAVSGYEWVYAYHTTDGEVSNASPVSQPSGPILGKMGVPLAGVGSANANCDRVWIFRTADGGSGSTLLKLADVANPGGGAAWTFTDTLPDDDLNVLIQAAIADENTAPPAGAINLEFHMGRLWMSVGTTVFYTRTTSAIGGDPFSAVPPNNFFTFPSQVTRLFSCAAGLMVFTRANVYIILGRGTNTDPFWSPGTYLKGHGLLHYDAFCVNGSTPYFLNTARKLVAYDPGAGVVEPGFPIGDQIKKVTTGGFNAALFDPSSAFLTWHEADSGDTGLFLGDGATGYFRMCPTSAPETGTLWSPFAALAGGCSAIQSVETTPGNRNLLVGPKVNGPILMRDRAAYSDNGTLFTHYHTIGSIVMAQPGQSAEIEFITVDSIKVGSRPVVKILLGEISGKFETLKRTRQDPPLLPPSKTLWNDRYEASQNQQPTYCRHLQLRFDYKAEAAPNEILAFAIFGALHNERRA